MIEFVHTQRQTFTAMQITIANYRQDYNENGESPLPAWVMAVTGCDYLYGRGTPDFPIQFSGDKGGEDCRHARNGRGAIFGDWLVLGEDGIFFFVERDAFDCLFEVEGENICRECRLVEEPHVGPGTFIRNPTSVCHSGDCSTMAWLKPSGPIEHTKGIRDDLGWRHPDLIG